MTEDKEQTTAMQSSGNTGGARSDMAAHTDRPPSKRPRQVGCTTKTQNKITPKRGQEQREWLLIRILLMGTRECVSGAQARVIRREHEGPTRQQVLTTKPPSNTKKEEEHTHTHTHTHTLSLRPRTVT
jgi:hypothetical protein